MKKRKKIIFFIAALLALTVWDLSETVVAEATTGQVTVTGRIGETAKEEEEADDDNKKTIVADASQIGQGKITANRFFKHKQFDHPGYALLVLFVIAATRKKKHGESVAPPALVIARSVKGETVRKTCQFFFFNERVERIKNESKR